MQKAKYSYKWRSYRLYSEKDFQEFTQLCKRENTTPTKQINSFIRRCAKTKQLEATV